MLAAPLVGVVQSQSLTISLMMKPSSALLTNGVTHETISPQVNSTGYVSAFRATYITHVNSKAELMSINYQNATWTSIYRYIKRYL